MPILVSDMRNRPWQQASMCVRPSLLAAGTLLAVGAIACARVWLAMGQSRMADFGANLDDTLYLNLARHLTRGEWLGPYDVFTLARPPGYPLWIAANHSIGWPLYLGDNLLYVGACALFARAVWPLLPAPALGVALFASLAFNPMSYGPSALEFMRDSIYPAQTLLVLACVSGTMLRLDRPGRSWLVWTVALGLSLGFFWISREESIWILPTLALAAGWAILRLRAAGKPLARGFIALGVAGAITSLAVGAVAAKNLAHYGLFTTCETQRPEFVEAYSSLAKAGAAEYRRWVPLPRRVRRRIYAVSPAFRELEGYFEGAMGDAWSRMEGRPAGDTEQRPNDIYAGFLRFVLRDAAAEAGHHASAERAMAFYARLAKEVNAAMESGEIEAGASPIAFLPAPRLAYVAPFGSAFAEGARRLVSFEGFRPFADPSYAGAYWLEVGRELTGDLLNPNRKRAAEGEPMPSDPRRLAVLRSVGAAYRWGSPALWALGIGGLAWLAARRRLASPLLAVCAVAFVALVTRLGLLALVEASAFSAISLRYLAPLYPLVLVCPALVACQASGRRGSSSSSP